MTSYFRRDTGNLTNFAKTIHNVFLQNMTVMKAKLILLTLLLGIHFGLFADNTHQVPINLEHKHKGGPRSDSLLYPDMPAAYYEYSPKGQRIIIDGGGAVSYYDVEISSVTTGAVEMTTTVSGTYDTFNILSLSPGTHVITIESPSGNTFEGTCFYKS